MLEQAQHGVINQVRGGLLATDHEKLKEPENLLLGQALAIDLGLDEMRQQVIMRSAAPLLDHVCEVRAHFDRNRPEIARCTLRLRPPDRA